MSLDEIRTAIHKMVDAVSDKRLLELIYTFVKYLK